MSASDENQLNSLEIPKKTVVVVLGMLGSGVQLVVQGLEMLGVDFCPMPNNGQAETDQNNPFLAINNELDQLLPPNWRYLSDNGMLAHADERLAALESEAAELLDSQLKAHPCLGLCLPKLNLLAFWKKLFVGLSIRAIYVISHRNPLSIAASLENKHSMLPEKSYYLWLETIMAGFHFGGGDAIVVDYDLLVDKPEGQMLKMAQLLDAGSESLASATELFAENILNLGYRHEMHNVDDVFADPLVPIAVRTAAKLMDDIIDGKAECGTEEFLAILDGLAKQTESFVDSVIYPAPETGGFAELMYSQAFNEIQVTTQRNQYIGLLHQTIAQYYETIAGLKQVAGNQASDIERLNQVLVEREGLVQSLTDQVNEKNGALVQVHRNSLHLAERLKRSKNPFNWRFFKSIGLAKLVPNKMNRIPVHIIPMFHLTGSAANWTSVGDDPQFILVTSQDWEALPGWYWLEAEVYCEQPLNAQLFFNIGNGFDPALKLDVGLEGKGLQRIPLFISQQCCGIRLDPCDFPVSFRLSRVVLCPVKAVPELTKEFSGQFRVYEALGARQGNVAHYEPLHGVHANASGSHSWGSEGSDPWFLLTLADDGLQMGWHQIDICMHVTVSRGNAKLYFNYGEGFSEADSLELPFASGIPLKRLCQLPAKPLQVRFDPLECDADFSIQCLQFRPVTKASANEIMLNRLRNCDQKLKKKSVGEIQRWIKRHAKRNGLNAEQVQWERYNKTFASNGPNSVLAYSDWIAINETPEFEDIETINTIQNSFDYMPLISVVMPVYNTPEIYLRKAIESVRQQSYPHWELCIADDASPNARVREVLSEYKSRDPRIKVVFRPENGHISAASNSALELATGDYVALLDHDDELAVHALHFIVEAINKRPSAQIVYSDEDKVDQEGNRSDPHFKSDWNPDLFFSQNYVSHLGVYRRDLLNRIGGFRVGVEGSQDQDLLLRCLPYTDFDEIIHVPKVLYHWRILEGSTALDSGEKTYTTDAGIKSLRDYFNSLGRSDVSVEEGLVPNTYRVRYLVPEPQPLISLLIPTKDMLSVLKPCITSIIEKTTYHNYEIIILDNGSVQPETHEYFEALQAEDSRIKVIPYNFPFNYSAINNYGAKYAQGELIGLINNDVEVISPEWLTEMVGQALRPEIGCVGAKLYYDDDTIQHAGVIVGLGGVAGHSHKYFPRDASGYFHRLKIIQNLSAVTAACLVLRKSVYEEVGGLEEDGLKVAFNDVDFCLKVRAAGYRNLWTPYAELYHYESKSRGAEDTPEKVERFNREINFIQDKWGGTLKRDPFYSENLTLAREDFSL